MRHSQAFFVGLVFAASTVASAVDSLTPSFIPALKASEFCTRFKVKCTNIGRLPPIVTPGGIGPLVCYSTFEGYCGSGTPILVRVITNLNQISALDREKRIVELKSNSTIRGAPARYILTEDVGLANRLANNEFSYTIPFGKGIIDIKPSNFVSPLNLR